MHLQVPSIVQIPLSLHVIAGSQSTTNRRNDSYYQSIFYQLQSKCKAQHSHLDWHRVTISKNWKIMKHNYVSKIIFCIMHLSKLNSTWKTHEILNSKLPDWSKTSPNDIDILEQESPKNPSEHLQEPSSWHSPWPLHVVAGSQRTIIKLRR